MMSCQKKVYLAWLTNLLWYEVGRRKDTQNQDQ